ncbi:hypothetical protein CHY08_34195 (plasmid) [Rhizobium leguminosarum bv. viciae]|uniref:hypothetical protein n=1 Tax=Rhizobium leguminosarum TaxID=384 RepID=UPI000B8C93B2|nr:hypothetical protein [Rhizobium leguminosarum]ASR12108.1 hypothetical protein CHY08_34195 [Rhizobium leguminosarum bv. viciae]
MSETVERHVIRYPNCRASTLAYLRKRDETTGRLMQEVLDEQLRRTPRPWWKRLRNALTTDALRGGR